MSPIDHTLPVWLMHCTTLAPELSVTWGGGGGGRVCGCLEGEMAGSRVWRGGGACGKKRGWPTFAAVGGRFPLPSLTTRHTTHTPRTCSWEPLVIMRELGGVRGRAQRGAIAGGNEKKGRDQLRSQSFPLLFAENASRQPSNACPPALRPGGDCCRSHRPYREAGGRAGPWCVGCVRGEGAEELMRDRCVLLLDGPVRAPAPGAQPPCSSVHASLP